MAASASERIVAMKTKQRKRKTDAANECGSSSKVGKVTEAASDKDTTVTSRYFEAKTKNPKLQLKKNAKDKSSTKNTVCGGSVSSVGTKVDGVSKSVIDDGSITGKGGDSSEASAVDTSSKLRSGERLDFKFYDLPCEGLAKALLGQILVMKCDGKRLAGKIVETEAYLGPIDKGAHSYKGKTNRNEAMFMQPGTAYVYNIYGMYCCMNISAQGDGAAVLLRALQPVENLEIMDKLRTKGKEGNSLLKKEGVGLCNGPSKLCQALGIKKDTVNKVDLCHSNDIWLEKGETIDDSRIVKCKRININYAEEWKDKPLRFYIKGNIFNSVKDKKAENAMSG